MKHKKTIFTENMQLRTLIHKTLSELKMETTRLPHYKNLSDGLREIDEDTETDLTINEQSICAENSTACGA